MSDKKKTSNNFSETFTVLELVKNSDSIKDKALKIIEKAKKAANSQNHEEKEDLSEIINSFKETFNKKSNDYSVYSHVSDPSNVLFLINITGYDKESINLKLSDDKKYMIVRSNGKSNLPLSTHNILYSGLNIQSINLKIPLHGKVKQGSIQAQAKNGLLQVSLMYESDDNSSESIDIDW